MGSFPLGVIRIVLKLKNAPTVEPIDLPYAKLYLRCDNGSLGDNISVVQSIFPGVYDVASPGLKGVGVGVFNYRTLIYLSVGDVAEDGALNVKIQESDTDVDEDYTDWVGGAFAQVTTANDRSIQKIEYTGNKLYIRPVADVVAAPCGFSVDVIKEQPYSIDATLEDALISALITTARDYCEGFQNRAYVTQTWELWMDSWPDKNFIRIPLPPLQKINSIKYYGADGTEYTLDVGDYFVDDKSIIGRVVLNRGRSWPSVTLRSANAICVEFDCGYGDADDVPVRVKQSMLLLINHWYNNREVALVGTISREVEFSVKALLWLDRVVPL